MKTTNKNSKVLRTTTFSKEYKNYHLKEEMYWDEGIVFYPKTSNRWARPRKTRLMRFQWRMYRTWKYNRKTKWK